MHAFDDQKVKELYADNNAVKFRDLHKVEATARPYFRYLKKK